MEVNDCWAYEPSFTVEIRDCNEHASLKLSDRDHGIPNKVSLTLSQAQLAQVERAIREYREDKEKEPQPVTTATARA